MNSFKVRFSMFFKDFYTRQLDFRKEVKTIIEILKEREYENDFSVEHKSIFDLIQTKFKFWDKRDTYLFLDEFLKNEFPWIFLDIEISQKQFISFVEFIYTIVCDFDNDWTYNITKGSEWFFEKDQKDTLNILVENLERIATKLNCEFRKVKNNRHQFYELVTKDLTSDVALQLLGDEEYKYDIYNYQTLKNVSNLKEKRKILSNLWKYFEKFKKEDEYKNNSFQFLFSNIDVFSNNFSIRHIKNDRMKDEYKDLKQITEIELEEIYDKLFQNMLLGIIVINYLKNDFRLNDLKEKYIKY